MGLTIEARREFVSNAAKLGLWFTALRTSQEPGEDNFQRILTAESPVYRLTEFWDGENHPANPPDGWRDAKWEKTVAELKNIFKASQAQFEEEGYTLLEPLLFSRIEKDLQAWPWLPCGYCTYKLPDSNVFGAFAFEPADDNSIAFHIANNRIPHSPFENMPGLRNELASLVDYVMEKYPEYKKIWCNSWLNSLSRFQTLFPAEWIDLQARPGRISYGYNWWGQLVSHTGGFNFRNAKLMRENGTFPFPAINGSCTLESLRKHLKAE